MGSVRVIFSSPDASYAHFLLADYNPRHFPNPEAFRPDRWTGVSTDSDLFVGFGHGPRACIGRKFSLVEATAFIVMLLKDWRVRVELGKGETAEQWQRRVMFGKIHALTGMGPIPIRLIRRS